MSREADITRYVHITHAHNVLAAIGEDARRVAALAESCPFDDGGDRERPLHDALALYRDAAGRAATGEGAPITPLEVDDLYSTALAGALDTLAERAAVIARRASAVRHALDAGLITNPREWTADDINAGHMLTVLQPNTAGADGDGNEYEWYPFDAMHLAGCVDALNRERLAGTVEPDTYDRHMARIAAAARVTGDRPAEPAEHVAAAVEQWEAEEDEAAAALAEPGQTLPQRHAISLARTYKRLAAFAADLTGPAWEEQRRTADKHMAHIYRVALELGTDDHGNGPKSPEAADLLAALDEWRTGAYAARMKAVNGVYRDGDDGEGRTEAEVKAAEEAAYLALYDATDFAVSTGQLRQVWDHAAGLEAGHADIIRTGVILRFEESRTGTGCTLVDGGPFAEHTKALRKVIDAYPIGERSNITHAVNYRALRKTIEDIAMGGMTTAADMKLIRAWRSVVDFADSDEITRRQVRELRDLVNAKVAEWCDGDERRAASLAARLPEWERIRDELNA